MNQMYLGSNLLSSMGGGAVEPLNYEVDYYNIATAYKVFENDTALSLTNKYPYGGSKVLRLLFFCRVNDNAAFLPICVDAQFTNKPDTGSGLIRIINAYVDNDNYAINYTGNQFGYGCITLNVSTFTEYVSAANVLQAIVNANLSQITVKTTTS